MGRRSIRSRTRKRLKWAVVALLVIAALAFGVASVFSYLLAGERQSRSVVRTTSHATPSEASVSSHLKVMTLNLAHGRKDGTHQLLQSTERIRSNLDEVARVLTRDAPDVVALQEADGPSFWSGGFSHIEYLAEKSAYGYFVRAEHVKGLGLSYGTAVLSKPRVSEARFVTFEPAPPSPSKGFLVATVEWALERGTVRPIDVISVHLDFSRQSVRQMQVADLIRSVMPRERPLIVMGDFNCSWMDDDSAVVKLVRELGLKVFQPESSTLHTFPSSGRRLDWILISGELEFSSYKVIPDTLSDHLAVVAEVVVAK